MLSCSRALLTASIFAFALPVTMISVVSPLAAQEANARADMPSIPRSQRPMIAVRDFEFQAQLSPEERQQLNQWTALGAIFGRGREGAPLDGQTTIDLLGKQVTTLMQEALQSTGNFRLFERTQIDAALREQNLGESDRAKPDQGRAEKGEILVARYVVTGAITKFGKAEKKKGLGGGMLSTVIGGVVGGTLESKQTEYDIGITLKLIEASTGEVLETFTVDGSALGNKSRRIAGLSGTLGGVIGGAMSNSTTGEKEKLIAQSIRNAVEKAAVQMVAVRERGDLTVH